MCHVSHQAADGAGRGDETEDVNEEGGLPDDLKGTNSKHLNRLIVEKQVPTPAMLSFAQSSLRYVIDEGRQRDAPRRKTYFQFTPLY